MNHAHHDTMRLPLHDLVADLNENLGRTLVAYMANVRSRQLPPRWATPPGMPGHIDPRDGAKQRLLLAHQVFHALKAEENDHVARQWLIGANPRFDGDSPAERIREYAAADVLAALGAFLDDTGGDG